MNSRTFVNIVTNEQFVCPDVRAVQTIDGVEYIAVQRPGTERIFLMRKEALKPVKQRERTKNSLKFIDT
jgi:hypothetical protein